MDCEVAREALSARLDGEREPVPSARVDEHVLECAACRAWSDQAAEQAAILRRLVQSRPVITPLGPFHVAQDTSRGPRMSWRRWALLVVGVVQLALAAAQGLGLGVGFGHGHGDHLLNESTAWSIALALAMIGAALRPRAAAGLAGVLAVFVTVLTGYVVADALSGMVTVTRICTHLPVLFGAVLAILVWRRDEPRGPIQSDIAAEPDIVLPQNASRGRRRGHLWPTDGAA